MTADSEGYTMHPDLEILNNLWLKATRTLTSNLQHYCKVEAFNEYHEKLAEILGKLLPVYPLVTETITITPEGSKTYSYSFHRVDGKIFDLAPYGNLIQPWMLDGSDDFTAAMLNRDTS